MPTTYCTQVDVEAALREDRLVQLTDDDLDGAIDAAVVTNAIQRASSRIDAYAGAAYDVPFDEVPAFVRDLCVELVIAELMERMDPWPDSARDRRSRAERDLDLLSKGRISLGEVPQPSSNPDRAAVADSGTSTFTPATMRGF